MAVKIKLLHLRLFVVVIVLLFAAYYLNSPGFKAIQQTKSYDVLSLLKGAPVKPITPEMGFKEAATAQVPPSNAVTYQEYDDAECAPVRLQQTVIQCKADPTVTDRTITKISGFSDKLGNVTGPYLNALPKPWYAKTAFVQTAETRISAVSVPRPSQPILSFGGAGNWLVVIDSQNNDPICGVQRVYKCANPIPLIPIPSIAGPLKGFIDAGWCVRPTELLIEDTCQGVDLEKDQVYTIITNAKESSLSYSGIKSYLYYSNPDIGNVDLRLPETENCYYFNWKETLQAKLPTVDLTTFGDLEVNGVTVKNRDAVISKLKSPTKADSLEIELGQEPPIIESEGGTFIIGTRLPLGFYWTHPYSYVEKARIIPNVRDYNGYLGECDYISKKVYGYVKETLNSNICYFRPESTSWVIKSEADLPKGSSFCCSASDCLVLGSAWGCYDNICTIGKDNTACNNDLECPIPNGAGTNEGYIKNIDGTATYIKGTCEYDPQEGFKKCNYEKKIVACDPTQPYPDGQCCHEKDGKIQKLSGEDCEPPGLLVCEDKFGASACCLDTQTHYTFKPCGGTLECCGAETDGVGVCKSTCEVKPKPTETEGIWGQLQQAIADALGVSLSVALLILVICLIILAILAIKAIFPRSMAGAPLMAPGTGGGQAAGYPIIIVK